MTEPNTFIYLFAIGQGIGKGFMYSPALYCGYSHLPGRKGVVSGCIISGYGFGGFIFGMITGALCNPDNISVVAMTTGNGDVQNYFPEEVAQNVPSMIRKLDMIWVCLWIIGLITITEFDGPKYNEHEDNDIR